MLPQPCGLSLWQTGAANLRQEAVSDVIAEVKHLPRNGTTRIAETLRLPWAKEFHVSILRPEDELVTELTVGRMVSLSTALTRRHLCAWCN